ncbi:ankyrin repeat domain-containing protein 53-like [Uloborus diversus]|uniref:ankyrin repeat domain-containing protein 53-like n=1 Tax=Uloborus diversus TaxID=327109 RepID=UPI002408F865|nr:ankyrin repeat domain-containing protein 53-like [Uloborus diversus]
MSSKRGNGSNGRKKSAPAKRPAKDLEEPPRRDLPVYGEFYTYQNMYRTDMQGRHALHRAAKRGDEERVKELLGQGFNPILYDIHGYTPLLIALNDCCEEAAQILIEEDCGINLPDKTGKYPLHVAANSGLEECVKLLLFMGANPHVLDNTGIYPLEEALSQLNHSRFVNVTKMILRMCALKDIALDLKEMDVVRYKRDFCNSILAECRSEIQRMKEAKIKGSSISFFDIATEDVAIVARYVQNKNILKVLNGSFETFPNYSDMIAYKVKRAKERRALTDQWVECFTFKTRQFPKPCTDIISLHLSDRDMRSFITGVEFSH